MPEQASQPAEPTSLPAPYVNPWGALGQNLRAVLADCRLRIQELWRRNGEGDLWRPQLWPRDLAPLFWPLVSGVIVLALVAVTLALSALVSHNASPINLPRGAQLSSPGLVEATAPTVDSLAQVSPGEASDAVDAAVDPATPVPEPQVPAESPPDSPGTPEWFQGSASSLPAPDPLLLALQDQTTAIRSVSSPKELLVTLEAQTARNALVLILGEPWGRQTAEIHQQLADLWWQIVEAQGYDELSLRSEAGVVLGRSARVGKGMVINESLVVRIAFTGMTAFP